MDATAPFDELLDHAGAVTTRRRGRPVVTHYGSMPGELAVCLTQVGLAVRSDLAILRIRASERLLERTLTRLAGQPVAVGGITRERETWWCRSSRDEATVVAPLGAASRLSEALRHDLCRIGGATIGVAQTGAVLQIVGSRAGAVLASLGVHPPGCPQAVAPHGRATIAGCRTSWLFEDGRRALLLTEEADVADVWLAVLAAGRAHGIACVGLDAIERHRLHTRRTGDEQLTPAAMSRTPRDTKEIP